MLIWFQFNLIEWQTVQESISTPGRTQKANLFGSLKGHLKAKKPPKNQFSYFLLIFPLIFLFFLLPFLSPPAPPSACLCQTWSPALAQWFSVLAAREPRRGDFETQMMPRPSTRRVRPSASVGAGPWRGFHYRPRGVPCGGDRTRFSTVVFLSYFSVPSTLLPFSIPFSYPQRREKSKGTPSWMCLSSGVPHGLSCFSFLLLRLSCQGQ